jgi:hypothetical protein
MISQARGFIAYRGPSLIDGAPVAVVMTFGSHNEKTGPMAQAWVLCADQSPTDAIRVGADRSICGSCIHRSGSEVGRSCYVVPWLGPLQVYKAMAGGHYPTLTPAAAAEACAGESLRLAAYGDPAAVPLSVWTSMLERADGWTGYTHQWRTCDQRFQQICMASVESENESQDAQRLGWRTFRTRMSDELARVDEIICPASDEAGHRVTCDRCTLCVGTKRARARSIVIIAHGQRTSWLQQHKERVPA